MSDAGPGGFDNPYDGMGHTIVDNNQVALSGSSYDGLRAEILTVVPETAGAVLVMSAGLAMVLRRKR